MFVDSRIRFAILPILIAFILLARDVSVFALPSLRVEDGKDIFAYFYANAGVSEIFRFKVGYIPLLPNLIGYGLVRLPARLIPYGFVGLPLLFSVFVYSVFFAPAYRVFIKSDLIRATLCSLFALTPFFHYDLYFGVDYIIWNSLFLLSLLLLVPAPRAVHFSLMWLAVVSLLIFSNPLSIIFLPVLIYWLVFDSRHRLVYFLCIGASIFYFIVGISRQSFLGDVGLVDSSKNLIGSFFLACVLLVKQAFRSLFGTKIYLLTPTFVFVLFFVLFSIFLCVYLNLGRKGSIHLVTYCLYVSFSIIFLSILARGADHVGLIELHMRYAFVPGLLTYIILFAMAESFLCNLAPFALDPIRAIRNFCLGIFCIAFLLNFAMGYYRLGLNQKHPTAGWYSGNITNGLIVRRFFRELEHSESRLCAQSNLNRSIQAIPLQANKADGDWSFSVHPRCRSEWMLFSQP